MVSETVKLLLLGIVFHAVFLWSIFDIYFVSPVVHISRHFGPPQSDAPAKRVVVISADGLRADKLFQLYPDPSFAESAPLPDFGPYEVISPDDDEIRLAQIPTGFTTPAPYLRSLITGGKAAWGVSHTRVPTESRPGHVAMMAGMYEVGPSSVFFCFPLSPSESGSSKDVSAVLKGWQVNPVHFDSTLNQSTHAWAYGSPDIVPMFQLGASPQTKVDMLCYDAHDEDFSKDAIGLDTWVMERVRELFNNATAQPDLHTQLQQPGNLFFFHLLGLDTTGHSYRPHSPEYYRNIAVVDRIVETVVFMFDQFYKKLDGDSSQTTFILTADHGMSNIGNHGDGHPDNTRTPVMAWGAGIETNPISFVDSHDEYSASWGLSKWPRQDMEQADLTALISAVVGNPFPGNSVGILPYTYLKASPRYCATALLANARGIMEQFIVQHQIKAAELGGRFKAFPMVHPTALLQRYERAEVALADIVPQSENITKQEAAELVQLSLKGLRWAQDLHTYDWLVLRVIVVISYVAWMSTTATCLLRNFVFAADPELKPQSEPSLWIKWLFCAGVAAVPTNFAWSSIPVSYIVYMAFASLMVWLTLRDMQPLSLLLSRARGTPLKSAMIAGSVFVVLEAMVVGYFERRSWSLALVLFAASGWYWIQSQHKRVMWALACLLTGVFTLLPVEKGENILLVGGGGFIFLLPVLMYSQYTEEPRTQTLLFVQMCLIAFGSVIAMLASASLQAKKGLPLFCQVSGWLLLSTSLLLPPYLIKSVPDRVERLILLIFCFVPVFTILTISYETLFYLAFSSLLLCWLYVEQTSTSPVEVPPTTTTSEEKKHSIPSQDTHESATPKTVLGLSDLRRACILLALLHIAFFGTGNVASISSFYLEPVYRLVPVFSPFLMAALLLFKIMIPFLILASTVTVLTQSLGLSTFAIFLLALCISDVLTLNFFFLVKDTGSWLDIGQSISHFAISNLLLVFCGMLNLIGAWLMQ